MPSRSNAHPSGSVTSSTRRPLSGHAPVKRSACRPSGSSPPSGSSGTKFTAGSSRYELRLAPVEVRERADLHQRRHVGEPPARAHQLDERAEHAGARDRRCRRSFAGTMVVGQRDAARASATVPSAHSASFRGLSPAPSHHLGVDVFVGTGGRPDVSATSGVSQAIAFRRGPPGSPGEAQRLGFDAAASGSVEALLEVAGFADAHDCTNGSRRGGHAGGSNVAQRQRSQRVTASSNRR